MNEDLFIDIFNELKATQGEAPSLSMHLGPLKKIQHYFPAASVGSQSKESRQRLKKPTQGANDHWTSLPNDWTSIP